MSTYGFEHVTKRFGGETVFDDFSLRLPADRASCLMGASGCGKTTLLHLLMGLERPDSGCVHTIHPQSAVFQENRLLPALSALGNLRLVAGRKREPELAALLAVLGLTDVHDKPVRAFSGGMKRRVAIARALAAEYRLLLLDEPFKGLDEDIRTQTARVIRQHAAGKTILLVSHDREEAALLDAEVIRLDKR